MSRYYDRNGNEMTAHEWQQAFEKTDARRIERTDLKDGVYVSTVWLGLDHSWDDGPPLIFETMVFEGKHDGDCYRYSTENAAKIGHAKVVAELRREQGE